MSCTRCCGRWRRKRDNVDHLFLRSDPDGDRPAPSFWRPTFTFTENCAVPAGRSSRDGLHFRFMKAASLKRPASSACFSRLFIQRRKSWQMPRRCSMPLSTRRPTSATGTISGRCCGGRAWPCTGTIRWCGGRRSCPAGMRSWPATKGPSAAWARRHGQPMAAPCCG